MSISLSAVGLWRPLEAVAVQVQDHRREMVVAHYADKVDYATLAEFFFGAVKSCVRHASGIEQFIAKVVDDLFVWVQLRPLSGGYLIDRINAEAGFQTKSPRRYTPFGNDSRSGYINGL